MLRTVAALLVAVAASAPLSAQTAGESSFVILIGADTLMVERFTRTADRLEGSMTGAQGLIEYDVTLGAAPAPRILTLRAWPAGAAATDAPAQAVRITVDGDSAMAEITTPAGAPAQRLDTEPGAIPFVNPSFALMEEVVRQARMRGGETEHVHVLLVQGGVTAPVTVTRQGADSVRLTVGDAEIHAAVSTDGRLLSGSIPAQNLTFTRVSPAQPAGTGPSTR